MGLKKKKPGSLGRKLSNPQGRDPCLLNREQGRRDEEKKSEILLQGSIMQGCCVLRAAKIEGRSVSVPANVTQAKSVPGLKPTLCDGCLNASIFIRAET